MAPLHPLIRYPLAMALAVPVAMFAAGGASFLTRASLVVWRFVTWGVPGAVGWRVASRSVSGAGVTFAWLVPAYPLAILVILGLWARSRGDA